MEALFENLLDFASGFLADNWKMLVMWLIGGLLIYLAIKKDMEPSLLLPIGFGAILMNLPGVSLGVDAAGHPKDTRTPAQRWALLHLLSELRRRYPKARIYGHRDFAPKACPCFDATKEYAGL